MTTTDKHAHFTGEGSFCDFPGCANLRDRLSDDGVKVVVEDTVDAILPVIEQHIRESRDEQAEDIAQAITDVAADLPIDDGCSPVAVRHGLGLAAEVALHHGGQR